MSNFRILRKFLLATLKLNNQIHFKKLKYSYTIFNFDNYFKLIDLNKIIYHT